VKIALTIMVKSLKSKLTSKLLHRLSTQDHFTNLWNNFDLASFTATTTVMEAWAIELFEGDLAHLKVTLPAIREVFKKVIGRYSFGSQEHKDIAAQLCLDV
jgi:hypothetical protein